MTTEPSDRPRYLSESVRSASGHSHGWHRHEFGQLILAASGSMQVGTETLVLLLSPAMVLWIPPDARHWLRSSLQNEMLYVDVNRSEAAWLGRVGRVMSATPLLGAIMRATLPEAMAQRAETHRELLYDLLRAELLAAPDVPLSIVLPVDRRIRAIAERALSDPAAARTLDGWLEGVAASRKTVERLFIAETGMAPSRWFRQARILQAVAALAAGEKVVSVALNAGYSSPSAFSFMFRRALGVNPSHFCPEKGGGRRAKRTPGDGRTVDTPR